jgi:citrate lyase subunit beta/citryl-CoA lyase
MRDSRGGGDGPRDDIMPVNLARTFLFAPASRLDQVEKALLTTADVVIIDLEDAVRSEDKARARGNLALLQPSRGACVRINDETSDHFEDDIAFLAVCRWVSAVMLPKVQSAEQVGRYRLACKSDVPVLALIESAQGIVASEEIAASGVSRLLFGSADYTAELGAEPNEKLFAYPRSRLVVASAATGLPSPVDGPTLAVHDDAKLIEEATAARLLGMGGKLCIHPAQVSIVDSIFRASASDVQWAREVLDVFEKRGDGVVLVGGEMVDAPVVTRARKILGK